MRILLLVMGLISVGSVAAQEQHFRVHQYRVENGLPSDVIKSVSQDTLGFFWIATDEGLVKYDGIRFTTYKRALQSQYAKGLLRTKSGRLLAIGDLDFVEIVNGGDTVVFNRLLQGTRSPTDSTIWYPKSIYEDRHGSIWLSEPQSVVRYRGQEKFDRYDFGKEKRSPVYHRSFLFFETSEGKLYTISYQGDLYRYSDSENTFEPLSVQWPKNISHIVMHNNVLWLASGEGLFKVAVTPELSAKPERVVHMLENSYFVFTHDSSIWVSSYENDLRILRKGKGIEKLQSTYNDINHLYLSYEGDLWVSTDKGLVLLQQNRFELADPLSQSHFVEDMAYDASRKSLYYCYKEALIELKEERPGEFKRYVLYEDNNAYFQTLNVGKQGLWASVDFRLQLYKNRRIVKEWNFSMRGDFLHDVFIDKNENVWVSQPRSEKVMMIDSSLTIHEYFVPINRQSEINLIREGKRGIYAASSGAFSYLFLKTPADSEFKNISLPIPFTLESDLNVNDIAVQDDVLWLATTEGLLRYDHQTVTRVNLGEMTSTGVTSVEVLDEENLLFTNSFGLLRYNITTSDFWVFDESTGLPSNTFLNAGILVDAEDRIWAGTSYGLGYSTGSIINLPPTPTPHCVEVVVNGVPSKFSSGISVPYNGFVSMTFSPISFPENKILLQWKYERDSAWRFMRSSQLTLSNLETGTHKIYVRAKKNTGEGWSKATSITLKVGVPLWQQKKVILLITLAGAMLVWTTIGIGYFYSKRRRRALEDLIAARTRELQLANDELKLRNTELDRFVYSVSHDLSAPLKSILGLIMVARMEPSANYEAYFERMEKSVRKLEEFIKDVVSYSRNTRMPLRWEKIDFLPFVNSILQDHQFTTNFNRIKFNVKNESTQPFISDTTRLKIILNNLISNSIKFHRFDGDETPYVTITLTSSIEGVTITVADNGCGIGKDHLNHIFDMFYRAEESAQGSGLGLYILKETVTKLRGTVMAKSELNKGTVFIIKLPQKELLPA